MSKFLFVFALKVLCVMLMTQPSRAETGSQRNLRLAHSIIAASGLLALSNDARIRSKAELTKRSASLAEQTRVLLPLAQRWSPTALTQRLVSALSSFSYTEKKQLLRMLRSPIALGISQREARMLEVLSTPEFQRYAARIKSEPPLEARIELMRRLDKTRNISMMAQHVRTDVMNALQNSRENVRTAPNESSDVAQRVVERLLFAHRYQPNTIVEKSITFFSQPLLQRWFSQVQVALAKPIAS